MEVHFGILSRGTQQVVVEEYKDDDIGGSFLQQTNTRVESDVHVVALALTMSTVWNKILMFKLNNQCSYITG